MSVVGVTMHPPRAPALWRVSQTGLPKDPQGSLSRAPSEFQARGVPSCPGADSVRPRARGSCPRLFVFASHSCGGVASEAWGPRGTALHPAARWAVGVPAENTGTLGHGGGDTTQAQVWAGFLGTVSRSHGRLPSAGPGGPEGLTRPSQTRTYRVTSPIPGS